MPAPILPGAPQPLRTVLKGFADAIAALQQPGEPRPAFAAAQADLPPPAAYPHCVVLVADLNILAHSDGVHWIRQDTGASIV